MTTNVPLPQFTPAGLVTYSEQDILAGVQADYVSDFALSGKTLSTELTTPQGQLATSQAYMVADFQALLAQLIANFDPLTSSGAYQDALLRLYLLTRKAATYGTVPVSIGGVPGSTFAAGAMQARSAADGTIWANQAAVTIAPSGTATATFQALVAGSTPAVTVGTNSLTIYQSAPGWQTVTATSASVPGLDVETRAEAEVRRQESVQIGGNGTAQNVRAAVAAVTNVTDVYVYNNGSDAAITYGATSYPIPAHSVAISVTGGLDVDVATAIQAKLDAGCGMSSQGTTSVTLADSVNYAPPYPQYVYRFIRPPATEVYLTVNVANLTTLPADYVVQVQKAIAAAFLNGFATSDGSITVNRARIGAQIIAAAYLPVVNTLANITPVEVFIGFTASPASGLSVMLGIDQQPVCPATNITVNAVTI